MPVDTSSIVLEVVCDCNFNVIAPVSLDSLSRVSSKLHVIISARTGPGYWPLNTIMGRSKPSGAIVIFVISKLYCGSQHM